MGTAKALTEVAKQTTLFLLLCTCAWAQQPSRSNRPEIAPLSPQEVFKRVSPSVFIVEALDSDEHMVAFGSGVLVTLQKQSPSSHVVESVPVVITNRHVVEGGTTFRVRHGQQHWSAKVTHWDDVHDLCGLMAVGMHAPPTSIRPSSSVAIGERVYAIGAPKGLELTLSEGLVSGFRDFEKEEHVIQTSAAISKGSSGGGLFDSQAQLIGVTTFYLSGGQNLNFAIPGERILELSSHDTDVAAEAPASSASEWSSIGWDAKRKKNYEKAIRAYREAHRLEPHDDTNWSGLCFLYEDLRNYDEALKCYREAASVKKDSATHWSDIWRIHMKRHAYNDAVAAAQEIVRLEPSKGRSWMSLGTAYLAGQHQKEAIRAFQECVRLEPGYFMFWEFLGHAQRDAGQLDESVDSLQQALRLNPDGASVWYQLGLTYSKQGKTEEAEGVWFKLMELDSDLAAKLLATIARIKKQ